MRLFHFRCRAQEKHPTPATRFPQQWINDVFNQIPIAAINYGINVLSVLPIVASVSCQVVKALRYASFLSTWFTNGKQQWVFSVS